MLLAKFVRYSYCYALIPITFANSEKEGKVRESIRKTSFLLGSEFFCRSFPNSSWIGLTSSRLVSSRIIFDQPPLNSCLFALFFE